MEVLESELRRYNINVMGLAETKWKGKEGHYYTTEGNMVIPAENNVRECGVGFIVDSTSSKAVIDTSQSAIESWHYDWRLHR